MTLVLKNQNLWKRGLLSPHYSIKENINVKFYPKITMYSTTQIGVVPYPHQGHYADTARKILEQEVFRNKHRQLINFLTNGKIISRRKNDKSNAQIT